MTAMSAQHVRPPVEPVRRELLDAPAMLARAPAWDDLLRRALRPSPFASPALASAHAAHGIGPAARYLAAWRGERLVALLALTADGVLLGGRRRPGIWTSPYAPEAVPLVDADRAEEATSALLDGLADIAGGGAVAWPLMAIEAPTGALVRKLLSERGWPHAVEDAFGRAVFDRRGDEAQAAQAIGRSRRRDLDRRRRRLAEAGRLEHRSATSGAALAEAVEAFLRLEASGWKGRAGTALASTPATAAFARTLYAGRDGPVTPRADLLCLDGQAIAASLALVCGGTAALHKAAYDEAWRRFAPGLVLEDAIVAAMHREGFAQRLDSVSAAGHVLESIYPDREPIGDLVFATGGMGEAAIGRLMGVERLRRAALARLKRLMGRG